MSIINKYMAYKSKIARKRTLRRPLLVSGVVLLCVLVIGSFLGYHHYHKSKKTTDLATARSIYSQPQANPHVPGGSTGATQGSGISSSKGGNSSTTVPVPSADAQPSNPVGEFVSNHKPNLSGAPAPNTESSTCTTTAGVICQITFTNGSTVKSLPAQKTDSQGNTSWSWTLQSAGLSEGTWQIAAVATNGAKTATSPDLSKLVISQ
jgi:hypothetical protein